MRIKKQVISTFIFLLLSFVLFTGCASMYMLDDTSARGNSILGTPNLGTPEDSVLVYGCFDGGFNTTVTLKFFQANTAYAPCFVHPFFLVQRGFEGVGKKPVQVTKPLAPGGRYKLYTMELRSQQASSYAYNQISYTWYFGVQGSTDFDFIVPQTPGLYYCGAHKIDFYTGERKETRENPKDELTAVEVALSYYRGTAWEPLLKARREELKNAK